MCFGWTTIACYKCQASFAVTDAMLVELKRKVNGTNRGRSFFCPNGHGQVFNLAPDNRDQTIARLEQEKSNLSFSLRQEAEAAKAARHKLDECEARRLGYKMRGSRFIGKCGDCGGEMPLGAYTMAAAKRWPRNVHKCKGAA